MHVNLILLGILIAWDVNTVIHNSVKWKSLKSRVRVTTAFLPSQPCKRHPKFELALVPLHSDMTHYIEVGTFSAKKFQLSLA